MAASTVVNTTTTGEVFIQFSPTEWRKYVYKEVLIESIDKKPHKGWVQTIDPVSKSVVLACTRTENKVPIEVVMGHAIRTITILSEVEEQFFGEHKVWLDRLCSESNLQPEYSLDDLLKRKLDLKAWLERNRIPVRETGDNGKLLSISDALFIQPPYGLENCISTNEIILGRVQALISSKPSNADQT